MSDAAFKKTFEVAGNAKPYRHCYKVFTLSEIRKMAVEPDLDGNDDVQKANR